MSNSIRRHANKPCEGDRVKHGTQNIWFSRIRLDILLIAKQMDISFSLCGNWGPYIYFFSFYSHSMCISLHIKLAVRWMIFSFVLWVLIVIDIPLSGGKNLLKPTFLRYKHTYPCVVYRFKLSQNPFTQIQL